jgi:hypothetical protein
MKSDPKGQKVADRIVGGFEKFLAKEASEKLGLADPSEEESKGADNKKEKEKSSDTSGEKKEESKAPAE